MSKKPTKVAKPSFGSKPVTIEDLQKLNQRNALKISDADLEDELNELMGDCDPGERDEEDDFEQQLEADLAELGSGDELGELDDEQHEMSREEKIEAVLAAQNEYKAAVKNIAAIDRTKATELFQEAKPLQGLLEQLQSGKNVDITYMPRLASSEPHPQTKPAPAPQKKASPAPSQPQAQVVSKKLAGTTLEIEKALKMAALDDHEEGDESLLDESITDEDLQAQLAAPIKKKSPATSSSSSSKKVSSTPSSSSMNAGTQGQGGKKPTQTLDLDTIMKMAQVGGEDDDDELPDEPLEDMDDAELMNELNNPSLPTPLKKKTSNSNTVSLKVAEETLVDLRTDVSPPHKPSSSSLQASAPIPSQPLPSQGGKKPMQPLDLDSIMKMAQVGGEDDDDELPDEPLEDMDDATFLDELNNPSMPKPLSKNKPAPTPSQPPSIQSNEPAMRNPPRQLPQVPPNPQLSNMQPSQPTNKPLPIKPLSSSKPEPSPPQGTQAPLQGSRPGVPRDAGSAPVRPPVARQISDDLNAEVTNESPLPRKLELVNERAVQYRLAAKEASLAGDKEAAVDFFSISKDLQALYHQLNKGAFFDMAIVPRPPPSRHHAGPARDPLIEKWYDETIAKYTTQIQETHELVAILMKRQQKDKAAQMEKFKAAFRSDIDSLIHSRLHNKPPPKTHSRTFKIPIERSFPELAEDEGELEFIAIKNFLPKGAKAKGLELSFSCKIDYPEEKPCLYDSPAFVGPDFPLGFKTRFGIERTKGFTRFLGSKKGRLVIEIKQRGFFRSSKVGHAEVPLAPLSEQCELHAFADVLDPENQRSAIGGQIEIKVRLRHPLTKRDVTPKEYVWTFIDKTAESAPAPARGPTQPAPRKPLPPSSSSSAPPQKPSHTSLPSKPDPLAELAIPAKPAAKSSSMWTPEIAEILSFDALKYEEELAGKQLEPFREYLRTSKPLPDDMKLVNRRRLALQRTMGTVEQSLGSGGIDGLKKYVASLEAALPALMQKAATFAQSHQEQSLERVKEHIRIYKNEVQTFRQGVPELNE